MGVVATKFTVWWRIAWSHIRSLRSISLNNIRMSGIWRRSSCCSKRHGGRRVRMLFLKEARQAASEKAMMGFHWQEVSRVRPSLFRDLETLLHSVKTQLPAPLPRTGLLVHIQGSHVCAATSSISAAPSMSGSSANAMHSLTHYWNASEGSELGFSDRLPRKETFACASTDNSNGRKRQSQIASIVRWQRCKS